MNQKSMSIGTQLVKHCQNGTEMTGLSELYHAEATSLEPDGKNAQGVAAIKEKHQWWAENFEVHEAKVDGPFPNDDEFTLIFEMDVTHKESQQRSKMKEVGLYKLKDDKIVSERFFYAGEN